MNSILAVLLLTSILEGVPPELLIAICTVESGLQSHVTNFNDGQGRNSHGLCQVQTRTARSLGFTGSVKDLYNPAINARYAARYLKYQLTRYKHDWQDAASAYNAGHVKMLKDGRYCNQSYVDKVLNNL